MCWLPSSPSICNDKGEGGLRPRPPPTRTHRKPQEHLGRRYGVHRVPATPGAPGSGSAGQGHEGCARSDDLLRAARLAVQTGDDTLVSGTVEWLADAAHPDRVALKAELSAAAPIAQLLSSVLERPAPAWIQMLGVNALELLSRVKVHRPPLYRYLPAAARLAVDPPAMDAAHAQGWSLDAAYLASPLQGAGRMQIVLEVGALGVLTNLMDSIPHRATALAAAPRLLETAEAMLRTPRPPPGAPERERWELAFTVLASYVQQPQVGDRMADLLVGHACDMLEESEVRCYWSVYRSLKCLQNLAASGLHGSGAVISTLVSRRVAPRLYQLLSCDLGEEARNVLFNLSGTAPLSFLQLGDGGGNSAGSRGTAGGAADTDAAAAAAVRLQVVHLDPASRTFNVPDAMFAIHILRNLATQASKTYCPAMLDAGVAAAALATCDCIADSEGLQDFVASSDNNAMLHNAADACMEMLMHIMLYGLLAAVGPTNNVKEHPRCVEQRQALVPRLRKYLLHPDNRVRMCCICICGALGCLPMDTQSDFLKRYGPDTIQMRIVARLMDSGGRHTLNLRDLEKLPQEAIFDVMLPPWSSFEELRVCDACGTHNHFRTARGLSPQAAKLKLKRCSACKQRRYCSEACQAKHWKAHKQICGKQPEELAAAAAAGLAGNPRQQPAQQQQQQQRTSGQEQQQQPGATAAATEVPTIIDFSSWPVRRLKEYLATLHVDCSRCIEKSQLVELCRQHNKQLQG